MWHSCLFPCLLLVLPALAGCAPTPFALGQVTGKVTYEDGTVIPCDRLVVTFHPVERAQVGKDVASFAQAEMNAKTGEILFVTTFKARDGAPLGRHKVTVLALKMNNYGGASNGNVGKEFESPANTPLECEIKAGSNQLSLTVPPPKKKAKSP